MIGCAYPATAAILRERDPSLIKPDGRLVMSFSLFCVIVLWPLLLRVPLTATSPWLLGDPCLIAPKEGRLTRAYKGSWKPSQLSHCGFEGPSRGPVNRYPYLEFNKRVALPQTSSTWLALQALEDLAYYAFSCHWPWKTGQFPLPMRGNCPKMAPPEFSDSCESGCRACSLHQAVFNSGQLQHT